MTVIFPGETADYRTARRALLEKEIELRNLTESVAEMRRALPQGGPVPVDYTFTNIACETVPMSRLFGENRDTLAIYSLMFRPDASQPCPMCVSLLDGLDGQARHIGQNIDFAVVSAASPEQLKSLAHVRNWKNLRLLSARGTTYQSDYHAETEDGAQLPMMNIFRKTGPAVFHCWASEMFFADVAGQPRHLDQLWPLWNMLDLTPQGRGTDWHPGI